MPVKVGAGTDPLGLDAAKFKFIDHNYAGDAKVMEFDDGDGAPLQDDIRARTEKRTLQYGCLTDTPEADGPEEGDEVSGILIVSRSIQKNGKGHNIMTLNTQLRAAKTTTKSW